MGWFKTGYDQAERAWEDLPSSNKGPKRVWMPPDATQRYLFLDDDPTSFWEHNFLWQGSWQNWEPCITRNQLGDRCPMCDKVTIVKGEEKKGFSYLVGMHTVISLTPWFTKKHNSEVIFGREIFAAKLGSKAKPGVLKTLKRIKEKHGRMRGLIFDIHRPGKQTESCGSDFDLVEKIDSNQIKAYATQQLQAYLDRINPKLPNDKKKTMEQLLKYNPWEPFNFEEMIEKRRRSLKTLDDMFGKGGSVESGGDDSKDAADFRDGSGGDDTGEDESDSPY